MHHQDGEYTDCIHKNVCDKIADWDGETIPCPGCAQYTPIEQKEAALMNFVIYMQGASPTRFDVIGDQITYQFQSKIIIIEKNNEPVAIVPVNCLVLVDPV